MAGWGFLTRSLPVRPKSHDFFSDMNPNMLEPPILRFSTSLEGDRDDPFEGMRSSARPGAKNLPKSFSQSLHVRRDHAPRPILICLPHAELTNAAQLTDVQESAHSLFGCDSRIFKVRPNRLVVARDDATGDSAIPSFATIDGAFQAVDLLQFSIDQADSECAILGEEVERAESELDEAQAEKQSLLVQNALLREKIRAAQEEAQLHAAAALRLKSDFNALVQKNRDSCG